MPDDPSRPHAGPAHPRRFPRSQRFTISEAGVEAESRYRATIVASRVQQGGRSAFDTARSDWAKTFGVEPDDGLYLAEVSVEPRSLEQLVKLLETCGKSKEDAVAAVARLVEAGLFIATTPTL